MRLALISDMHGNVLALDAVLADLDRRPADRLVCLGDCVQGGAQPAEVAARLRALGCPVVMGNADAYVLTGTHTESATPSPERRAVLDEVREWTFARLPAEDRAFVARFEPTVSLDLGGRGFIGYHGGPDSFDTILLPGTPVEEFERALAGHATDFMAGGHVHQQFVRHLGNSVHFNPGSAGMAFAIDAPPERQLIDPWAEYAVLEVEDDRFGIEFRRVPYDVGAYLQVLRDSGQPHAADTIRKYRFS
jgi:predicted phosphodiesterase